MASSNLCDDGSMKGIFGVGVAVRLRGQCNVRRAGTNRHLIFVIASLLKLMFLQPESRTGPCCEIANVGESICDRLAALRN